MVPPMKILCLLGPIKCIQYGAVFMGLGRPDILKKITFIKNNSVNKMMNLCEAADSGVYFKCQGCGECCSSTQEGYVFIYQSDVNRIQAFLDLPITEIAQKYITVADYEYTIWDKDLRDTGKREHLATLILNYGASQDCIFLTRKDGKAFCNIYEARPLQCQLYPFWNIVMLSTLHFKSSEAACQGMNVSHNIEHYYSRKKIEESLMLERKSEYDYIQLMKLNNNDIYQVYPFLKKPVQIATNKQLI